jgi:iron complex outermembrane receptor protein
MYFDRYFRDDIPTNGSDKLKTFDLDFQHRFAIKNRHNLVWGLGSRLVKDHVNFRTTQLGILPPKKNLQLFQGFIQDEIKLHDRLKLTLGTRILHNEYSGLEVQPSARAAFAIKKSTLWTAVSRAVRTPSRFDVEYYLPAYPVPPTSPSVAGGPNFVSEKLVAYELGYRIQPAPRFSFSIATFYNVYNDLYSVEPIPGTLTYQIQNGSEGKSWGAELSGSYQLSTTWKLRSGYTFFDKKLKSKPGHSFDPLYLGNDVKNQVMLQSILDLPFHLQIDVVGRYLDHLPKTAATAHVPAYVTLDARIAYLNKGWELSIAGQNISRHQHTEFNVLAIPRNIYAKISFRF